MARPLSGTAVTREMDDVSHDVQAKKREGAGASRAVVVAIVALCLLRAIAAAILPLSADEAYYWLWSRHLSAGYFDHPPAIAYVIRAGTLLFGPTSWGLRAGAFLSSLAATWLVWQSAALLLGSARDGARAALYFNLTLMVGAEMLAATPDAPELLFSAAFLYALVRLKTSGEGVWWLFAGVCAGLALLSKYTALFLGLGTAIWLVASSEGRRWLPTMWPYAGVLLASLVFAPNLVWNAEHHWQTFAFQFARIGGGEFSPRFLGEFIAAQLGLATPFILMLSAIGATVAWKTERQRMLVFLVVPPIAYFLIHALHDRVQANWTSFLFPAFSILAAASSLAVTPKTHVLTFVRRAAVPVAALMLALTYAQALIGIFPIGRADPLSRLLGFGIEKLARQADELRAQTHANGIITTDYATAAWLAFYARGPAPVSVLGEDQRWAFAETAPVGLVALPKLYVVEDRHDARQTVSRSFSLVAPVTVLARDREGVRIARYVVYRVSGPRARDISLHTP